MWREPWSPQPPGGYRPPDPPPFGGLGEQLALYGLLTTGIAGLLVWLSGQLAGLVFGPTGSFKTSAAVIPGILEWQGPLVATSVKPDVLRATLAARSRKGEVLVLDPLGASGLQSAQWTPVASCGTWAGAQQTAVQLANAIEQTPTV